MSLMLKKKGGKVFAPKVPARRPTAPSSSQSSARPSVERQSQTPAPPVRSEIVTIPDDDNTHDWTNDPTSRTSQTTPHQSVLQTPHDAFTTVHLPLDAAAHISRALAQDRALPPGKQNLKRKTRDGEGKIEVPRKRHQPLGLDASKLPQSGPAVQNQTSNTTSGLAQPSESNQSLNAELAQRPSEASQRPKGAPVIGDGVLADEISGRETAGGFESSQASSRVPEIAATTSRKRPLLENTQNDPASGTLDPETSVAGLRPDGTTSGLGAAGDVGSSAQTPVIVPMAPLNPDGTPGEAVQQAATGKKKKLSNRRKVQAAEDGGDIRATVEMQLNRPKRTPGQKPARKRKESSKRSSKRADTPEGAENEEIDKSAMTMLDMCKDLRIGKKFSMHDELRQREKQKVIRAKVAKYPHLASLLESAEKEGEGGEAGQAVAAPQAEAPDAEVIGGETNGPQMRIINGQIVVDENSMQVDRHKRARAQQGLMEAVVENEFSKIITCGSLMKREKALLWDMAANEIFWKGLRMFGANFEMIASMFPNRNRRQIKLKFSKEEKDNPHKIDRILKGIGGAIDLDAFEELSGLKLEEVADIEAEQKRIEAEQQAEENRRLAEQTEAERKKREEILAKQSTVAAATKSSVDIVDDSGNEEGVRYIGDNGDSGDYGEKENEKIEKSRQTQIHTGTMTSRNEPKGLAPREDYFWKRKPQAETAEEVIEHRAKEGKPVNTWTKQAKPKAAKTPKVSKQGRTKKKGKKNSGDADETVQVLGDA